MQINLAEHSDQTNEIFNLMARQIKKRAEERVNLIEVTDNKRKENSLMRSVEQLDKESDNFVDHIYVEDGPGTPTDLPVYNIPQDSIPMESILSSAGNSPPKGGHMFSTTNKMGAMLETSSSIHPQKVTVKPFNIKPNVIYLKNSRDQMLLLTEKKDPEMPEDPSGYWGGFSPERVGTYKNQGLTKKFTDGRARIYPAMKKTGNHYTDMQEEKTRVDRLNTIGSEAHTHTNQSLKSSKHIFINDNGYTLG